MKYLLILLLSFTGLTSSATELRFGGWSKHLSSDKEYNETHNAFLFEHRKLMVGYFKNSFNSDTVALAYHRAWYLAKSMEFHVTAGAMYGYRDCFNHSKSVQEKTNTKNVCPLVYPEIRFQAPLRPAFGLLGTALVFTLGYQFE
jgi:hypothetical protein